MADTIVQVRQHLRGADSAQTLKRQASHSLTIMAEHQQAQTRIQPHASLLVLLCMPSRRPEQEPT